MYSRICRIAIAAVGSEVLTIFALCGVIIYVFVSRPVSFGQGERLGQSVADWVIPIAGFATCVLAGWWAARKIEANRTRYGAMVGVVAAVIDILFLASLGATVRLVFVLSTLGRIAGGAIGGRLTARREGGRPDTVRLGT